MYKIIWSVCFSFIVLTMPLLAVTKECSVRLVELDEKIAPRMFSLKEEIKEILEIDVPLVFNEEFLDTTTFQEGEDGFLAQFDKIENDYEESSDDIWSGSKLLKTIPPEQITDIFRYLNWYRFQQREIQRKFKSRLVNFNQIPALIDKFFALDAAVERFKAALILSHIRMAALFAIRGARRYRVEMLELFSMNVAEIPSRIDIFDFSFQFNFSTLLGTKFFSNGKKLFCFQNALKRVPKGVRNISIHANKEGEDTLDIPAKLKSKIGENFNSFIEELLPKFTKDPNTQKRFSMVFGLNGFAAREYDKVGRLEGVTRQAVQQGSTKILKRIRKFLEERNISSDFFED